jgi:hypothetical protein
VSRLLVCLSIAVCVGCGPYQIAYRLPSKADTPGMYAAERQHSHGIGPLLIGGGGYFFALQAMSPALIDYTGPVQVSELCPHGFADVTHLHRFWQNATAAGISWVGMLN